MKRDRGPADSKIVLARQGARPLLATINGQPRADYDAARKPRPSPATDDDPQSSSDEGEITSAKASPSRGWQTTSRTARSRLEEESDCKSNGERVRKRMLRSKPDGQPRASVLLDTSPNVRKRSHDEVAIIEDADELDMFGGLKSSQQSRRIKTFSKTGRSSESPKSSKFQNIFTRPKDRTPKKKTKTKGSRKVDRVRVNCKPMGANLDSLTEQPEITFRMPPTLKDVDELSETSTNSHPKFRTRSTVVFGDTVRRHPDESSLSSSPLSSLPTTVNLDSTPAFLELTGSDCPSPTAKPPRCPMCLAPVSLSFFESQGFGRRLTLREQGYFCRAHKRKEAEEEWETRGYPEIDWNNFDKRLMQLHSHLQDFLDLKRPSFYRNLLQDRIKDGRSRTLMQSLGSDYFEVLKPGYYGSRGARAIQENITRQFFQPLRHLAASDPLISSGGVSSYIQCVLVPEVAVMLVKQDMKLPDGPDGEEEARNILQQSRSVGDELCEELDDKAEHVHQEEEDEGWENDEITEM